MKTQILTIALATLGMVAFSQTANDRSADKAATKKSDVKCMIVQTDDDMVTVLFDKKAGDPVKIKVLENKNGVLYTKRIKKGTGGRIKYDISQFPAGTYVFELVKDKKVIYSKEVTRETNMMAASN